MNEVKWSESGIALHRTGKGLEEQLRTAWHGWVWQRWHESDGMKAMTWH